MIAKLTALGTVLWVLAAVVAVDCVATPLPLVPSHGFYDVGTTINGWPFVFRVGAHWTPQEPGHPDLPEGTATTWLSGTALFGDVAIAAMMLAGVAAASVEMIREAPDQKFPGTGVIWTVAVAILGAGVAVYCARSPELGRLMGSDLDAARLGTSAWYPFWTQPALGIGSASGAIMWTKRLISAASILPGPRPADG